MALTLANKQLQQLQLRNSSLEREVTVLQELTRVHADARGAGLEVAVHGNESTAAPAGTITEFCAPALSAARLELVQRRLFARQLLPTLLCPLTAKVFIDPVVAGDGFTYERDALRVHMRNSMLSPCTGSRLPSRNVVANRALAQQLALFRDVLPLPAQESVDSFARLSADVLSSILSYLDAQSLVACLVLAPSIHCLASDSALWMPLAPPGTSPAEARWLVVRSIRKAGKSMEFRPTSRRATGMGCSGLLLAPRPRG